VLNDEIRDPHSSHQARGDKGAEILCCEEMLLCLEIFIPKFVGVNCCMVVIIYYNCHRDYHCHRTVHNKSMHSMVLIRKSIYTSVLY
jgi:hypothetical protein